MSKVAETLEQEVRREMRQRNNGQGEWSGCLVVIGFFMFLIIVWGVLAIFCGLG